MTAGFSIRRFSYFCACNTPKNPNPANNRDQNTSYFYKAYILPTQIFPKNRITISIVFLLSRENIARSRIERKVCRIRRIGRNFDLRDQKVRGNHGRVVTLFATVLKSQSVGELAVLARRISPRRGRGRTPIVIHRGRVWHRVIEVNPVS